MKAIYKIRIAKGLLVTAKTTGYTCRGCTVTLDWLHVPPACRGQGLASKILAALLADADANQVTLRLVSKSCAQGKGLDQSGLDKFYARHGFQFTGEWSHEHDGRVMERRARVDKTIVSVECLGGNTCRFTVEEVEEILADPKMYSQADNLMKWLMVSAWTTGRAKTSVGAARVARRQMRDWVSGGRLVRLVTVRRRDQYVVLNKEGN